MKPTLLLLPGTLCDARIFRHQCRALRDLADLRALDYAGLDRAGAWLDRLLGELPEHFSIAGFSLGGLWALELLRRAPQRVQRLALIASNARPASGRARRRSASQWRVLQRQGPAAVARGAKPAYFHHPSQRQRNLKTQPSRMSSKDASIHILSLPRTPKDTLTLTCAEFSKGSAQSRSIGINMC